MAHAVAFGYFASNSATNAPDGRLGIALRRLLLRRLTGVGTPRSLQGRAVSAICRLIGRLIDRWGRLTRAWGFKWTPTALVGSIAHRQTA